MLDVPKIKGTQPSGRGTGHWTGPLDTSNTLTWYQYPNSVQDPNQCQIQHCTRTSTRSGEGRSNPVPVHVWTQTGPGLELVQGSGTRYQSE